MSFSKLTKLSLTLSRRSSSFISLTVSSCDTLYPTHKAAGIRFKHLSSKYAHKKISMAKKKNNTPPEETLLVPVHPARADVRESDHVSTVDTHTHLLSTFSSYQNTYKPGKHQTIWEFVRGMYHGRRVEAIVDVWCEAPVMKSQWRDLADSALTEEQRERDWGGLQYWFVMGTYKILL